MKKVFSILSRIVSAFVILAFASCNVIIEPSPPEVATSGKKSLVSYLELNAEFIKTINTNLVNAGISLPVSNSSRELSTEDPEQFVNNVANEGINGTIKFMNSSLILQNTDLMIANAKKMISDPKIEEAIKAEDIELALSKLDSLKVDAPKAIKSLIGSKGLGDLSSDSITRLVAAYVGLSAAAITYAVTPWWFFWSKGALALIVGACAIILGSTLQQFAANNSTSYAIYSSITAYGMSAVLISAMVASAVANSIDPSTGAIIAATLAVMGAITLYAGINGYF